MEDKNDFQGILSQRRPNNSVEYRLSYHFEMSLEWTIGAGRAFEGSKLDDLSSEEP